MAHWRLRRQMKAAFLPPNAVQAALAALACLLCAAPAAAVDCFQGNRPFLNRQLDEAIDLFEAALALPDCQGDRVGLQLNLALSLSARAAGTVDHCRAAELFAEVTASSVPAARRTAQAPAEIEAHWCKVGQAQDAGRINDAATGLRAFAARHEGSADNALQDAARDARLRYEALLETDFGPLSADCPADTQVELSVTKEVQSCPARWEAVPRGLHKVTFTTARGDVRVQQVEIQPGRENRVALSGGAGAQTERSNAPALAMAISAGVLAAGGVALLVVASGANDDLEAAKTDFTKAREPPYDAAAEADARTRYEDAGDRYTGYSIGGYSALGLAALLGAGAIWLWTNDAEARVALDAHGARWGVAVTF